MQLTVTADDDRLISVDVRTARSMLFALLRVTRPRCFSPAPPRVCRGFRNLLPGCTSGRNAFRVVRRWTARTSYRR